MGPDQLLRPVVCYFTSPPGRKVLGFKYCTDASSAGSNAMRHSWLLCSQTLSRRAVLLLSGATLLAAPAVWAQTPGRSYRIGFLTGSPRGLPTFNVLLDELRLAGFIEGQNLTVLDDGFNVPDNEVAAHTAAATALVKAPADAILAFGVVRIRAVQSATKTIPILTLSEDLIADGLVSSLARPDRNTTGISLISPDLDGKRGDLLLDAVPGLRHVAVLADPNADKPEHLQALMDSAKARGVELSVFSAKTREEIAPALDAAKSSGAGAINVLATTLFFYNRGLVIERTRELHLPAIYQWPDLAEQGGLIGYGPLMTGVFRLLGGQLVKILRGTNPADIPIEQPSKFELVVNLQTAKEIGLEIPANFVLRADKLIE
jgi:putative tryptophan/tyrosine transport system substrate-binding protein